MQAGLKFAMLASSRHYLTAQLLSYFPSGDSRSGLGTNHYSVEPALLYYQRLSERFEIEGELGGWLPIGGSQGFAGNLFFYGIGPSYTLINGERFRLAPVIEVVGWNVTGGLADRYSKCRRPYAVAWRLARRDKCRQSQDRSTNGIRGAQLFIRGLWKSAHLCRLV